MPKNKLFQFVAILLSFSLLLVGCSSNGSQSPAATDKATETQGEATAAPNSTEKVTIRIHLAEGEITKEQIQEFEAEHTNIKIERVDTDFNKLMGQIAANSEITPDIFRLFGASEFPFYASRGLALNLQPYFDASSLFKKDDLLDATNIYRWDGKVPGQGDIYGFPKDWAPDFNLFINKKLFEEAGIPIPSDKESLTWEKVMEYAQKLTKKDGDSVTQWGLYDPLGGGVAVNQDLLLAQLASLGQKLYSDDNSEIKLNTPEAKKVLQYWVDAVKQPVGPSSLHSEALSFVDLFSQNKLGMMIVGYWFSGMLRSNELTKSHIDDFMMLPSPKMDGGVRVEATRSGTGGIIYSKTKHPKEAWTVFEWFYGGKPADERAKGGWGLPGFKSKIALIPKDTSFDKQTYDVINDDLNNLSTLPYNPYISATAMGTIFDKYLTPVYFGKDTLDGAIEKISKEAKIQIQENKDIVGAN
ncbi:ABC transporter substrate-binding protein [Paenibacillus eucommiae]|uniref:Multiple sugar transport system substrate-binding protein n=1 Tax=Paenibacillus eucommiae TaxID=1355755 RepID=A0ABS4IZG6_9BACL|nr:sugar ABC transporter substrate-binding protein [Paenibacillus eucommiae]MBP1992988.1 multiple sugar transport system substrate-binding protein [Paenibacillus eucommiae]